MLNCDHETFWTHSAFKCNKQKCYSGRWILSHYYQSTINNLCLCPLDVNVLPSIHLEMLSVTEMTNYIYTGIYFSKKTWLTFLICLESVQLLALLVLLMQAHSYEPDFSDKMLNSGMFTENRFVLQAWNWFKDSISCFLKLDFFPWLVSTGLRSSRKMDEFSRGISSIFQVGPTCF